MKAWILNIGDEVLLGKVCNTNASFLGRELFKLGIALERVAVVGDDSGMIKKELALFEKSEADLLITTGGLGPTHDDLTKEAVFEFFGLKAETREAVVRNLEAYFGGDYPKTNLKQANFPQEAVLLENRIGTAPGAILKMRGKTYVLLVGPPAEMRAMFTESVLPRLQVFSAESFAAEFIAMGKGESEFEEYLGELYKRHPEVSFATYPEEGRIRFLLRSGNDQAFTAALSEFRALMEDYLIGADGLTIEEAVINLLKSKGYKVSVAESCTGGMLASFLVNVPGASDVFHEGFVTYSNEAKMKYLGVRKETLDRFGAVSEEVVREMVEGIKRRNGAEARIAISGIAGPGGGTAEKPVGLVHYAIGFKDEVIAEAKIFKGNREQIRRRTCLWVLYRLFCLLKADQFQEINKE